MASIVAASSANAGTLAASTILADFNAIIYTNASTPSDIEGAAVVGGNFSGATMYNNPPKSGQPAGFGALTVYGNTSGNSININDGGSAYVAGTKGAGINFNGGGTYIGAPGYSIADFETPLNALSQSLSQLNATSTLPPTNNNEVIKATPGSNGIAVFNVTAAQLAAIPSYSVSLNGASTVIFNVSGSSVSFGANSQGGTTGAGNIIWNFYNATSVNFSTLIAGTVLAPNATVTNGNQIDGALVAKAWNGSGELHDYPFIGTLPGGGTSLAVPRIPEPPAIGLLGVATIGLGLVMRHRRRRV
jgi:choice-of-anchor A domain-containing protein